LAFQESGLADQAGRAKSSS